MSTQVTARPTRRSTPSAASRRLLITAALASVALWFVPGADIALYPLRLFVTLVHEGGHALATVLTGGDVLRIDISRNGSGLTLSQGGTGFLVLMAGYLGTALAGAGCLLLSRRKGAGRRGLILLAACTLLLTGLWVHPWPHPFGFAMGVAIGGALVACARLLPAAAADFLLSFLAVQLCLNALVDVRDLLYLTTSTAAPNDAVFMAQRFGLTPWFWAILWAAGAFAILVAALRAYWRGR